MFADESHQQVEQLGDQNHTTLGTLFRVSLHFRFVQPRQRAIRIDLHRAQRRYVRLGPCERARKKRAKTGVTHEVRQMRTQLLTDGKGRWSFCPGRFISPGLTSNETLGKIQHLWSALAHLEIRSAHPPVCPAQGRGAPILCERLAKATLLLPVHGGPKTSTRLPPRTPFAPSFSSSRAMSGERVSRRLRDPAAAK